MTSDFTSLFSVSPIPSYTLCRFGLTDFAPVFFPRLYLAVLLISEKCPIFIHVQGLVLFFIYFGGQPS
jgi:hypothetical protein